MEFEPVTGQVKFHSSPMFSIFLTSYPWYQLTAAVPFFDGVSLSVVDEDVATVKVPDWVGLASVLAVISAPATERFEFEIP